MTELLDRLPEDEHQELLEGPSLELLARQLSRAPDAVASPPEGNRSVLTSPTAVSPDDQELQALAAAFAEYNMTEPVHFASATAEEEFVNSIRQRQIQLERALQTGALQPLGDAPVLLSPRQRVRVYLVFAPEATTCPVRGSRSIKVSGRVLIQPLAFDRALAEPSWPDPLPAYPLPVQARVCRLQAMLPQVHFHFGSVKVQDVRQCVLMVQNVSQLPFFYKVASSGSTAAGDFHLDSSSRGVIMPYKTRELYISYRPCVVGEVSEMLVIQNIFDPQNRYVIIISISI